MIGTTIKQIRELKGLTLSECAERANVSKSYLSNIERNFNRNPSIQIVKKIAAGLDVDLRTLIGTTPVTRLLDDEWLTFVQELQESGVDKDQLQEYKTVIEFAKWQNDLQGKKEK
ncbi:helix-turn-helix transcriptional regulator [Lentibacillus sp. N15]|uniref:helix-turn-helix domain-containing protein n=1 Tax=Lentibacillus songyuanensis TaxID=3136161 RepID=UPI0031BB1F82